MSMMVTGWDPFAELTNVQRTVDRLVNSAYGGSERDRRAGTLYIPVNVRETATGYEVEAPVPGFSPEDVNVTFADGVLTITAEHQGQETIREGQTLAQEFVRARAMRRISLSGDVDPENIEANIEHGVLTVHMGKASRSLPRRIPIGGQKEEEGKPSVGGASK